LRSVLVVHGPNLDRLGTREPGVYGTSTLADIDKGLVAHGRARGVGISSFQSNWEGALVERIHAAEADGIVINAAGLTHTSVVLRDALLARGLPFVEVHLSNVYAREPFRRQSLLADVAVGVVCGFGPASYVLGLDGLLAALDARAVPTS
jgi:3-dehydroquinate dehydratase-2